MITEDDLRTRVLRGATLLDERGPAGWRERLDLVTLDVFDVDLCVIGQLYPEHTFEGATLRLGAPTGTVRWTQWCVDHGFTASSLTVAGVTRQWRDYVAATRTQTQESTSTYEEDR